MSPIPSTEEIEELLLCCRYGELEDVQAFNEKYGSEAIATARDDRGNTVLHMCCANGHEDVLKYLQPLLPPSILSVANNNGSLPIHWAVMNNHVGVVQILADLTEEQGGGLPLLKKKNRAGRDAFAEATFQGEGKEEVAGFIEGWLWRAEGGEEESEPANSAEVVQEKEGEEIGKTVESGIEEKDVDRIVEKTDKVSLS